MFLFGSVLFSLLVNIALGSREMFELSDQFNLTYNDLHIREKSGKWIKHEGELRLDFCLPRMAVLISGANNIQALFLSQVAPKLFDSQVNGATAYLCYHEIIRIWREADRRLNAYDFNIELPLAPKIKIQNELESTARMALIKVFKQTLESAKELGYDLNFCIRGFPYSTAEEWEEMLEIILEYNLDSLCIEGIVEAAMKPLLEYAPMLKISYLSIYYDGDAWAYGLANIIERFPNLKSVKVMNFLSRINVNVEYINSMKNLTDIYIDGSSLMQAMQFTKVKSIHLEVAKGDYIGYLSTTKNDLSEINLNEVSPNAIRNDDGSLKSFDRMLHRHRNTLETFSLSLLFDARNYYPSLVSTSYKDLSKSMTDFLSKSTALDNLEINFPFFSTLSGNDSFPLDFLISAPYLKKLSLNGFFNDEMMKKVVNFIRSTPSLVSLQITSHVAVKPQEFIYFLREIFLAIDSVPLFTNIGINFAVIYPKKYATNHVQFYQEFCEDVVGEIITGLIEDRTIYLNGIELSQLAFGRRQCTGYGMNLDKVYIKLG